MHDPINQLAQGAASWQSDPQSGLPQYSWVDTTKHHRNSEDDWTPTFREEGVGPQISRPPSHNVRIISPDSSVALRDAVFSLISLLKDEDDEMRPTDYAYQITLDLIYEVGTNMKLQFPRSYIRGDGENGIRITWENAERQVTLQTPDKASRRHYIYYREGNDSGIKEPVTTASLEELLRWLS